MANKKLKISRKWYLFFGVIIIWLVFAETFVRLDKTYYYLRWKHGVHFDEPNANIRLAIGYYFSIPNEKRGSYSFYWREFPESPLYLRFVDERWDFERGKELGVFTYIGAMDGCYLYEVNFQGEILHLVYLEEFSAFVSIEDAAVMERWQDLCSILEER